MRDLVRLTRMATAAVEISVVSVGVVVAPAQASDEPRQRGAARFECQSEGDATAEPTPVTFALRRTADSVRPGDVVSLSGRLTITLSEAEAEKSQLTLAEKAKIEATDFPLVVRAGGERTVVRPVSLTSVPTSVRTPFTLSASVSYPDVTIPQTASGSAVVELAAGRTRPSDVAGTPAEVTFNATLMQDSLLVPERKLACWRTKPTPRAVVARLAVKPVASDGQPAADAGISSAAPAATSDAAPPGAAAASAPEVPAPDDVPVGQSSAPAALTAADPPAAVVPARAPIPAASVSDETFVPGWVLAFFIALFPLAAVAHAVRQRRRLRVLLQQTPAH